MPIYEYRCANGHTFELMHSMEDGPAVRCRECEAPVQRVFHPVAVHFKGSGFYTTDYGRERSSADGDSKGDAKASSDGAGPSRDSGKTESSGKSETPGSSAGSKSRE